MKAGAFGRQRERRTVQPGGRVLPGMFAGAGTAAAPSSTTTSSSPPPVRTEARSPPAAKADAVLSRFGSGGGQGSGWFSDTSRLDRPVDRIDEPADLATTRKPVGDSISRARRLGLNRAARTPSPKPELPRSPASSNAGDDEDESAAPAFSRSSKRHQEADAATSGQATRAVPSRPPESTSAPERQASTTDVSEEAANRAPARPLPGLLSSLWNRASELVGGTAPAAAREDEAGEEQHAAERLGEGDEDVRTYGTIGENEDETKEPRPAARAKKAARPIVVPALVAPALAGARPPSPTRTVSAPIVPAGPPPEPITYHRPPALHQRSASPETLRFRSQPSPYDWLDSRDESPLVPYMFLPTAAQAAAMEARMRAKAAAAQARAPNPRWPAAMPYAQPYPLLLPPHHPSSATIYPPVGVPPFPHTAVSSAGGAPTLEPGSQTRSSHQQTSTDPSGGRPMAGVSVNAPVGAMPTVPPLVQPASLAGARPAVRRHLPTSVAVASTLAPAVALPTTAPPDTAPAVLQRSIAGPPLFVPLATSQANPPIMATAMLPEPLPRYSESELPAHVAPYVDQRALATSPVSSPQDQATQSMAAPAAPSLVALPRAGNGGDSLPVHPSPAEIAPPAPSALPASFGQAASATIPMSVAQPRAPEAVGSAPPLATTAAVVQPKQQPLAPTIPPLVAPASLGYASAPQMALPPPATSAPIVSGVNSGLLDFGPLDVLKAAARNAVLAGDAPRAHEHDRNPPQQGLLRRAGPTGTYHAMEFQVEGDVPPMPEPQPIPVTPPPSPAQVPPSSSSSPVLSSAPPTGHNSPTSQSTTPLSTLSDTATSRAPEQEAASTAASSTTLAEVPTPSLDHMLGRASSNGQLRIRTPEGSSTPDRAVGQTPPAQVPQFGGAHTLPLRDWTPSTPSTPPTSAKCPSTTSSVSASAPKPPSPAATSGVGQSAPAASISSSSQLSLLLPPPVPARPASIPPLPRDPRSDSRLRRRDSRNGPPTPTSLGHPAAIALARMKGEDAVADHPDTPPIQPKLELQTLDLDFGDFGNSFSLATPTVVAAVEAKAKAPDHPTPVTEAGQVGRISTAAPESAIPTFARNEDTAGTIHSRQIAQNRVTSPLVGSLDAIDPLDRAFDETASFVADFAHATLERTRIDPNHSERTERWLEQTGVRAQPTSGLSVANAATDRSMPSFHRPMTAPPASVAPGLLQVTPTVYPAEPSAYGVLASEVLASRLPSSSSAALGPRMPIISTSTSLAPGSPETCSPLETAIGAELPEGTTLARGRPVAPNTEVRERDRLAALAPSTQTNVAAALQEAADTKMGGAHAQSVTGDRAVERPQLSAGLDFEPFVGDKGETASEVAAMFSNW